MDSVKKEIKEMIEKNTLKMSKDFCLDMPVKIITGNDILKYKKKIAKKQDNINFKLITKNMGPISLYLFPGPDNLSVGDIMIPGIFNKPKIVIYLDTFMNNFLYLPISDADLDPKCRTVLIYTLMDYHLKKILKIAKIIEAVVNKWGIDIKEDYIMKGKWNQFITSINWIAVTNFLKDGIRLEDYLDEYDWMNLKER